MKTRAPILQAQYIFRTTNLPDDTLLATLLPHFQNSSNHSHRYKLSLPDMWHSYCKPKEYSFHPKQNWNRHHAFECLHIHQRLYLPPTIIDPISFLLNLLPLNLVVDPTVSVGLISGRFYVLFFMSLIIIFMTNVLLLLLILGKSCELVTQVIV
jgi:hypothetical protein